MEINTDKSPKIINDCKSIYEDFLVHFGKCFHYKSTQHHAERYVRALLGRVERKNGWQMAEYPGDKSPHAIQNFLSRAAWDDSKVRDSLVHYAKKHLLSAEEKGVLIVDETGFFEKRHLFRRGVASV